MACQDNYIGKNHNETSRSGLYVSDLPGVDEIQYELISKDSETDDEVWERISRNSWNGLVSDIETFLQTKYWVNTKLLSRESSEFLSELNTSGQMAGVKISFNLSRYSRIHIVSLEVWSNQDYPSPEVTFYFYNKEESGDLIHTVSSSLVEGENTVFIDRDFNEEEILIVYDSSLVEFRQTKNRHYDYLPYYHPVDCVFPCFGREGSVKQVNDGGLNVIYNVHCSTEKFTCQNLNLFRKAFWWRYGVELSNERRIGNKLNSATTMTQERKDELFTFYNTEYQQALDNALKAQNIYEDWVCFECKGTVTVKNSLP